MLNEESCIRGTMNRSFASGCLKKAAMVVLTWAVSCGILCVKEMGAVPDVRYALEDLHFVWDLDKEALNIKKH